MTVLSRLAIAAGLIAAMPQLAHADLPGGAVLTFDMFRIIGADGQPKVPDDAEEIGRYLNLAHCECAATGSGDFSEVVYQVGVTPDVNSDAAAEAWVGTECDDEELRGTRCRNITEANTRSLTELSSRPQDIRINYFDVLNGVGVMNACVEREAAANFFYLVNTDQTGSYEHAQEVSIGGANVDTRPPPIPADLVATGGEESIRLSWGITADRFDDIERFQAFCSRAGTAVGNGTFTRRYQTTADVCGEAFETTMVPSPVSTASRGDAVTAMPEEFDGLGAAFLCGEAAAGSTELRINGLENGVGYKVALLVVDLEGNYQGTYFDHTILPIPVTDLWEDIHDGTDGDGPQGGCLSATRDNGGGPLSGLLVAMAVGGLVLWRRRRKLVLAGALLLAGGTAQADDFAPYWEQDEIDSNTNLLAFEDVRWHVGIKAGPYIPNIDGQAGKNATTGKGPYESMFGDYYVNGKEKTAYVWQVLPMLDIDYVVLRSFGQLTIGGSVGYMHQSALAYAAESSANDPMRPRAKGNETVFRLIPTQLAVGYRFTYLAERYGIPIIPYARGGLAYYMWMMRAPNGDLSRVCNAEVPDTMICAEENVAKGGSFGVFGSVGIAIRAEGIERDSARSMRETGVDHAGFYGEIQASKVDGFGASDKLAVGDTTFFAGFDFEF